MPVGNCFGFVGNRMLYAYGREKELMLLEGAKPESIDQALQEFGMAMGPNAVGDLAGLDIGFQARREWAGRPDDPRFYRVSDRLAELGRFGQKTGRGFYRYDSPDGKRTPDPEVVELIRAEAERLGIEQRAVSPAEIVNRCILALINEGARILEEGIAAASGRHRRHLVQWLRVSQAPRRPDVLCRHAGPRGRAGIDPEAGAANRASATGRRRHCSSRWRTQTSRSRTGRRKAEASVKRHAVAELRCRTLEER